MSPNSFSLLSPYLFSEWCPQFRKSPTVFILFIVVSVLRVAHRATALHSDKAVKSFYSRKALAGWKASRRLGKQIRGLSRFLSTSAQRFPISMTVSFSNTQFCIRQRFISVYCQYVFTPFLSKPTQHLHLPDKLPSLSPQIAQILVSGCKSTKKILVLGRKSAKKILVIEKFHDIQECIHNGKMRKSALFMPHFEKIP